MELVRAELEDDPTVDITTTGRRSGLPRRIEIWMLDVDGRFFVTGTPGRRDWLANLATDPGLVVHLKRHGHVDLQARATVVTDDATRHAVLGHASATWYRSQAPLDVLLDTAPMVEVIFDRDAPPDPTDLPRHVAENRRHWDAQASEWVESGARAWAQDEPTWGIWGVPNGELPLLPERMDGLRAIELGCGTGYVSAWMRRRGASVYAIDNSAEQLATARRLAAEHGIDGIEWVHGNAEIVDQPDASFDFAISEYGAAIWCDPHLWIVEAHRLLRPGGRLVFLGHHPLAMVCLAADGATPVGLRLERDYFGLGRLDWTDVADDPGGIEFNMEISSWIRLFVDVGFDIATYHEIQAPASADGTAFWVPAAWAKRFPAEQAWELVKR